ncbi:MAG: hypothetical protein MZW92_21520 [Comamonadaceae bacterium]|nr:hypothetical protein [Comamonadaceae bacterium]
MLLTAVGVLSPARRGVAPGAGRGRRVRRAADQRHAEHADRRPAFPAAGAAAAVAGGGRAAGFVGRRP